MGRLVGHAALNWGGLDLPLLPKPLLAVASRMRPPLGSLAKCCLPMLPVVKCTWGVASTTSSLRTLTSGNIFRLRADLLGDLAKALLEG